MNPSLTATHRGNGNPTRPSKARRDTERAIRRDGHKSACAQMFAAAYWQKENARVALIDAAPFGHCQGELDADIECLTPLRGNGTCPNYDSHI